MNAPDPAPASPPAPEALYRYTQWIYGLHALAVAIALLTGRSVAMRFAFSIPSIIAVIMNYARRDEVAGTWLASHFRWQIRTFWFAWLWILLIAAISTPLFFVLIGFFVLYAGLALVAVWIIYRVARGWLTLNERRPMPPPLP